MALVTGAAGDIGAATARAFAASGHALVLMDLCAPVLPEGAVGQCHALDLADPVAVEVAFSAVSARFGQLEALVNIAGINHRAPVAEMVLADWHRVMDVNVGSMFLTAKFGLPLLARGTAPAIVNMASISGHVATPDYPAYVTTKAAVESLTWALAQEVGPRGIRVNAVAPGWVEAGFTRAALDGTPEAEALLARARDAHLLGRMARVDEVAAAIHWLASPRASFVTGETLFVDGGLMRVH